MLSFFRSRSKNRKPRRTQPKSPLSYESLEIRNVLSTFSVVNLNDSGVGSLHQAIIDANAAAGADTISFNVAGTIQITGSALPVVSGALDIDGTTAPGFAATPVVEIDFNNSRGLKFEAGASGSALRSLALTDASGDGVALTNVTDMTIAGNFIGLALDGVAAGNRGEGLDLNSSLNVTIGGDNLDDRNVISANRKAGLRLSKSSNNAIVGNYIGTDPTGTLDLGNGANGILLTSGSSNNTIGGEDGNVVSGNALDGIGLKKSSSFNTIDGNFIGAAAAGDAMLGNGRDGIRVEKSASNVIGSANTLTSIDFYNSVDGPDIAQPATAWHGIQPADANGQFLLVGTSENRGLLYEGSLDGNSGISYFVDFPGATATTLLGVENAAGNVIRIVGTYEDANPSPVVDAFLFQGAISDLNDPAHYFTISYPGAAFSAARGVAGGLVVGNRADAVGGSPSGAGQAFIYEIATDTFLADVVFPGSLSNTVYNIWHNGGTNYTIAGGYSTDAVNNFNDPSAPIGNAFIVDFDSSTSTFSNWRSFDSPAGENVLTQFTAISGIDAGVYTLGAQSLLPGPSAANATTSATLSNTEIQASFTLTFDTTAAANIQITAVNGGAAAGADGNGLTVVLVQDSTNAGAVNAAASSYNDGTQTITLAGDFASGTLTNTEVAAEIQSIGGVGVNFTSTTSGGSNVNLAAGDVGTYIPTYTFNGRDAGSTTFSVTSDSAGAAANGVTATIIEDNTIANNSVNAAIVGGNIEVRVRGVVTKNAIIAAIQALPGYSATVTASSGDANYIQSLDTPPAQATLAGGTDSNRPQGSWVRITRNADGSFGDAEWIDINFDGLDPATDSTSITSIYGNQAAGFVSGSANFGFQANLNTGFELSNLISGNAGSGITLSKATDNRIVRNHIGTDITGTLDFGNAANGVHLTSKSARNTIGGDAAAGNNPTEGEFARPALGNLISGNDANGVLINGKSTENRLSGNFIGTAASGNSALDNTLDGIAIEKAHANSIVGSAAQRSPFAFYNVIGANFANGLRITSSNDTVVQGNFFGLAADNNSTLSNGLDGVLIDGSSQRTQLGGEQPLGNVLATNSQNGVQLAGKARNTQIAGNIIGLDATGQVPRGNFANGVAIGGSLPNANTIAHNGAHGVLVMAGTGHAIQQNSIFLNFIRGIDLAPGANQDQPAPVLTSVQINANLTITGTLTSRPNTEYRIEFFTNDAGESSGRYFLGSINVTTDPTGEAALNFTGPAPNIGNDFFTATATDPDNNTSEFSTAIS